MMNSTPPRRPALWAMALLLFSSGFTLISLVNLIGLTGR